MKTKYCKKCDTTKSVDNFGNQKSSLDGLRFYCKECSSQSYKKWYYSDIEKSRNISKRWRQNNPESRRASIKRWEEKNPDALKLRQAIRRSYLTKSEHTRVDLARILRIYENTCSLCDKEIDLTLSFPDNKSLSWDHIIPLSKGGIHDPENVAPDHLGCNSSKNNTI